jgi:hypothetical protein
MPLMTNRPFRAPQRPKLPSSLEPLEARIAPALIVDATGSINISESTTTANDNLGCRS